MLKRPLYELSVFIINNLSPNRLEGFDVESITKVANFYEVEEAEMNTIAACGCKRQAIQWCAFFVSMIIVWIKVIAK